ncbi:hypothetical protein [Bradyrhizobium erythrophlei]|jgi:hypothetical protein|uniref:Uncharacterized protein n=1 Tax=Bradyrhizobium erythrophlei TaxID=1437360 RepID=A0A1M5GRI3_9BRAD|nr:hypothetical protein [Bradyrhizobium erythrophlei]SHG06243.1 hypothetical protein SAMN05444169_0328 [Bradyrhizobium erythrophlei]
MRSVKRPLNWLLLCIALASVAAILLGQENPFVRESVCMRVPCPALAHSHAWEKIAYDLGIGSIVSLFFYWLVVRLPENAKRRRIRKSFAEHFREFKEDAIATMLMVTDDTFEWGFHRELVNQKKFRDYFKQEVAPGEDRWDSFHNKMTDYYLDELLTHLEILRGEILFAMSALEIDDKRVLEFLKRLSATIIRMRKTTGDYDSMKSFGNFMWEVFAGWSMVTGYQKRDFFEDMIQAI